MTRRRPRQRSWSEPLLGNILGGAAFAALVVGWFTYGAAFLHAIEGVAR